MSIRLRSTAGADLEFVRMAEAAEENCRFIGQWSEDKHRWALTDADHRHFILERLTDDAPVGYLILQGLADPNLTLQIRRIVVTEKGQGYGRRALQLVKKLAFESWGMHRLWLDVKTFNGRARQLYESEGFVFEGTLRECIQVGDRAESLHLLSILRSEYEAAQHKKLGFCTSVLDFPDCSAGGI